MIKRASLVAALLLTWPIWSVNAQVSSDSGGINYDTPTRFIFSIELGAKLLSHMQQKKPVSLKTIGGARDQKVGNDIQSFLEQNGFTVNRTTIGFLAPPPDDQFSFIDNPSEYLIVVSPGVH